ncbi:MAG: PDZ domain-containing protein, partial [Pontibacter sp.]|nr:PDZ domain-containing protein [Pontibacter sp.]
NELSKEYGPSKAFPENEFFDIFAAKTYPEIGDFFNRYIKGAEPLPLQEYYGKLGIDYVPATATGEKTKALGYNFAVPDGQLRLVKVEQAMLQLGLQEGDVLVAYNGTEINLQNANQELSKLAALTSGDAYTLTVERNGEKQVLNLTMLEQQKVLKHLFKLNEQATPEQVSLRNAWMKNM